MAKLTLTDITAGFLSPTVFNANNTAIETAMENTLSRDGTSPNTMSANIDMNSNKIVNLTDGANNQDAVTVAQLNAASIAAGATLDGLSDVDTTGRAANDLLVFDGTSFIDTAGILTWDRVSKLSMFDTTTAVGFTFEVVDDAGSNFNDWLTITGAGTDASEFGIMAQHYLGVRGDSAWGDTYVSSSSPAEADTTICSVEMFTYDGASVVAQIGFYGDSLFQTGNNHVLGDMSFYLRRQAAAQKWVYPFYMDNGADATYIQGHRFRIGYMDLTADNAGYSTRPTDYLDLWHDDTDFNINGVNTTDINITGVTSILSDAHMYLRGASALRVYEAGNADYMNIAHNGSNVVFSTFQTTAYRFEDSDIFLMDGQTFRVYDSGNDDFLQISCTAGQATIEVQGTGSPAGLTIDEATDFNGQTLQQFVAGNFDYENASEVVATNAATLTYSEGPGFELDLEAATGTVNVTISGGPSSGNYGCISVKVTQDGTAARTITWAGGTFRWVDGSAHPVTTTLDGFTIFTFESWDGGTTWWGTGADYA